MDIQGRERAPDRVRRVATAVECATELLGARARGVCSKWHFGPCGPLPGRVSSGCCFPAGPQVGKAAFPLRDAEALKDRVRANFARLEMATTPVLPCRAGSDDAATPPTVCAQAAPCVAAPTSAIKQRQTCMSDDTIGLITQRSRLRRTKSMLVVGTKGISDGHALTVAPLARDIAKEITPFIALYHNRCKTGHENHVVEVAARATQPHGEKHARTMSKKTSFLDAL